MEGGVQAMYMSKERPPTPITKLVLEHAQWVISHHDHQFSLDMQLIYTTWIHNKAQ